MNRKPRSPKERLFKRRVIVLSFLQGVSVLVIMLIVFGISIHRGQAENEARALAFTTLIFANIGLIMMNRSWTRTIIETLRSPNKALWWVVGGAFFFLGLSLWVPFLRGLFHFGVLHLNDFLLCFGAGVVSIIWFEFFKVAQKRFQKKKAIL